MVTCFTLCAIKTLCTAAVESVDSACAGPIVLTGMTCTVILAAKVGPMFTKIRKYLYRQKQFYR